MATYSNFPRLSRKPALKTRESTLDPTLRDNYENGMVATRARYTRTYRKWGVSIDFMTPADKRRLDAFVEKKVKFGALIFLFPDVRDPKHPENYKVRFSTLPAYIDTGFVDGYYRQNCTFELEEV